MDLIFKVEEIKEDNSLRINVKGAGMDIAAMLYAASKQHELIGTVIDLVAQVRGVENEMMATAEADKILSKMIKNETKQKNE